MSHTLKNKHNILTVIVTAAVIAVFAVSLFYYYNHSILADAILSEYSAGDCVYHIDSCVISDHKLEINGFCFFTDDDLPTESSAPDMNIILAEADDSEEFNPDVKLHYYKVRDRIARPEVSEYWDGDYTYCGFSKSINLTDLDLTNTDYEIVLQPSQWKSSTVRTGLYIADGELLPARDYVPLDTAGTDLEPIVNEGMLMSYRPDIGMYIYEYGWKLYYIADENYPFDGEWTFLGCNCSTNHFELLKRENRETYHFEILGFNLLDNEITDEIDTGGKYRVSVKELPDYFPVAHIDTGYWRSDNGWIWMSRFCPGIRPDVS